MIIGILPQISIFERCRVEAPWLAFAIAELGQKEGRGLERNNPRILEYISTFPYLKEIFYQVKDPKTKKLVSSDFKMGAVDETPWCACFVAWCLRRAGHPTSGMNAGARTWRNFGLPMPITTPRLGAIAVVKKHPSAATAATTTSGYHVSFYLHGPAHSPTLLGGNQGNEVCAKQFVGWTIVGYRWPSTFRPVESLGANVA